MNSIINEYLKATRVLTDSYKYSREIYINNYEYIKAHKDVEYDYPELILCYSLKKTCEQIQMNENKCYLIYDVALGRFMNYMDALIFSRHTSKWNIEMFFRKCYAEKYYSMGDYVRAFVSKLYVDEIKRNEVNDVIKKDMLNLERYLMVLYQELFIILHEISHYRLSKLTKEEYNKKVQAKREILIKNDSMIQMIINKEVDSFVRSVQDDVLIRFGPKMIEQINDKKYWEDYYSYLMEFYNDDKNVEEIMCDEYAVLTLVELYMSRIKSVSCMNKSMLDDVRKTIYISCYIGLENVNYLSKIEQDAIQLNNPSKMKDNHFGIFSLISNAQQRKRCLIRTIIQNETELVPELSREIGIYWSNMARTLDDLYRDIEIVFEKEYVYCDSNELISMIDKDFKNGTGMDVERIKASLYEILFW